VQFAEALANPGFSVALPEARMVGAGRASLWNPLSIGATVMAAIGLALAAWLGTRPEPAKPVSRFVIAVDDPVGQAYYGGGTPNILAITPDGAELIYVGDDAGDGQTRMLFRRPFAQLSAQPIPGTEGAFYPRVSADGHQVAFIDRTGGNDILKVASLRGGPPVTMWDSTVWIGLAWGPENSLYFFPDESATLRHIPAGGGPAEEVVTVRAGVAGAEYYNPTILPGGRGAIVTVTSADPNEHWEYQVHLIDLSTGESREAVTGVYGTYAASGHLVYLTAEGTLMAAPLDADAMALTGPPVAMFDDVGLRANGFNDLALADNGTLAYTTEGTNTPERVVWAMRDGDTRKVDPAWVRDEEFEGLALSPDGTRLAVEIITDNRADIWIKRLDQGPLSRLTFGGEDNINPTWTPDGTSVAFLSYRGGKSEVWIKRADGSGEARRLVDLDSNVWEASLSNDGTWLLLRNEDGIHAIRPGIDSVPITLIATEFRKRGATLSPDGRWLAYASAESGNMEIYLRPFPQVAATKVATIHLPSQNEYEVNRGNPMYAVAPDGRFLVIEREGVGDVSGDLVIVQNFFEELKAKVGN